MRRVECHIFSGLFSAGADSGTKEIERMIDDLPSIVDAHHHRHGRWKQVLEGILERSNELGSSTIILIGHSYGALRCQQIAKKLASKNISVSYLAGIDPTALFHGHPAMKLSNNIERIDEFHAMRGVPHRVRKSDPSGKGGGKFIVPNGLSDSHKIMNIPSGHIKCAAHPITRAKVAKAIAEILQI